VPPQPFVQGLVADCRVPQAVVDDCVQEAWNDIDRRLPDFDYASSRGRFPGWLRTITLPKMGADIEQDRRHALVLRSTSCLWVVRCHRWTPCEQLLMEREIGDALQAALAGLGSQRQHAAAVPDGRLSADENRCPSGAAAGPLLLPPPPRPPQVPRRLR
jgi:DNA-directed RNA polymerase specialized sigma24 family protein